MPLGKSMSPATCRVVPSGATMRIPWRGFAASGEVEVGAIQKTRPTGRVDDDLIAALPAVPLCRPSGCVTARSSPETSRSLLGTQSLIQGWWAAAGEHPVGLYAQRMLPTRRGLEPSGAPGRGHRRSPGEVEVAVMRGRSVHRA